MKAPAKHEDDRTASDTSEPVIELVASPIDAIDLTVAIEKIAVEEVAVEEVASSENAPMRHFQHAVKRRTLSAGPLANPLRTRLG